LCQAALAGDLKAARAINDRLIPLHRDLFVEANPIAVKWALAEMGRIRPGIRLPMTPLDSRFHATVRAALRASEVLP
jgi:4-hydroxy-tetrahydrodipicolinate synthase